MLNDTYYVRLADLNFDGLADLYVTGHHAKRAVLDFAMLQTPGLKFRLVAPTVEQQQLGLRGQLTNIDVFRADLSGDGLYDFQFENVDEWIPNAPDLTVLTTRFNGRTPAKVVHNDQGFLDFVDEIEYVLQNVDVFEEVFRGTVCGTVLYYVPVYVGNPYGYSWSADFNSPGNQYTYYGGYTWLLVQQQVCIPGSALFAPAGQQFFSALGAATGQVEALGELFQPGWVERVIANIKAKHPNAVVYLVTGTQVLRATAKAARTYRKVATGVAIVLAADDVTVIGAANDVLLIPIGLYIGGTFVLDGAVGILDATITALNADDVGPRDGTQTEGPVANVSGQPKSAAEMTDAEYQGLAKGWPSHRTADQMIPTFCRSRGLGIRIRSIPT